MEGRFHQKRDNRRPGWELGVGCCRCGTRSKKKASSTHTDTHTQAGSTPALLHRVEKEAFSAKDLETRMGNHM